MGEGGMSVVYRAEHTETHQEVAIKTARVREQDLVRHLRRETHALSRVKHPGVVRIVGEGLLGGLPWYAMELVPGVTLRDRIRSLWTGVKETQALFPGKPPSYTPPGARTIPNRFST